MLQPKFIHVRRYEGDSISSKGGRTIAYYTPLLKDSFIYAVAKCHEQDNFNKKVGRNKAAGRLKSKDQWEIDSESGTEEEFIQKIYNTYSMI